LVKLQIAGALLLPDELLRLRENRVLSGG